VARLRCSHCGDGLTFQRGLKDPPIWVGGRRNQMSIDLYFCGPCFRLRGVWTPQPELGEIYAIGLGDSPESHRWEPLHLAPH
jgi:hypothetical protein